MYSSALWNNFGDVRLRSVPRKRFGCIWETFILNVTKVPRKGLRGGATEFYMTGDFNVELGLLCTDEDIEELNELYGPLCWQGCENDHGGFKRLMWCGIMKEFNCKAASSGRESAREKGLREKGKRRKGTALHYRTQVEMGRYFDLQ